MRPDMEATVELVGHAAASPSSSARPSTSALVSDDGDYPLLAGDIGSTDGVRMAEAGLPAR